MSEKDRLRIVAHVALTYMVEMNREMKRLYTGDLKEGEPIPRYDELAPDVRTMIDSQAIMMGIVADVIHPMLPIAEELFEGQIHKTIKFAREYYALALTDKMLNACTCIVCVPKDTDGAKEN